MEQCDSLVLNEAALEQMPENKRPLFVHEWLRYLERILPLTQKADLKSCQSQLVTQLLAQLQSYGGGTAAGRRVLARNLATVFCVGDAGQLFAAVAACNELMRAKDDSPSQLPAKLAAIACVGAMYHKLGRMVGRSFEETCQLLMKTLKSAESLGRTEVLHTLASLVQGLGSAGSGLHKEIYKAAKGALADRSMNVRAAAAKCLRALVFEYAAATSSELEALASACFKAMDGANYDTRCAVAKLLGTLLAHAHKPPTAQRPGAPGGPTSQSGPNATNTSGPTRSLDECLSLLAAGFLRGGVGFLKGSSGITISLQREVRLGMTMAYIEFVKGLGAAWLERQGMSVLIRHVLLELAAPLGKASAQNTFSGVTAKEPMAPASLDVVYVRRCVQYILQATIGRMLGEKAQVAACRHLGAVVADQLNIIDAFLNRTGDVSASSGADTNGLGDGKSAMSMATPECLGTEHVLVCATHQMGTIAKLVGSASGPLFVEANGILEPIFGCLIHPCESARVSAAVCLQRAARAVPSLLAPLIDRCLSRLEHMATCSEAVSGYSLALAALIAVSNRCPLGVPHAKGKQVFALGEELLRTAGQSSRLALAKTRAGWLLLAAVASLGSCTARPFVPRMCTLFKGAFPRSAKEAESEKQRGDFFTWQVTCEQRAGALLAMGSLCAHCSDLVADDVLRKLLGPLENCLAMLANMPQLLRYYGAPLRPHIAHVRLRLYDVMLLLKPKYYDYMLSSLLRELVADVTLADLGASAAPASALASQRHVMAMANGGSLLPDALAKNLLGSALRSDTDSAFVESQVYPLSGAGASGPEQDACAAVLSAAIVHDENRCHEDFGPPPAPVAVLDKAVMLFGQIYPHVASKHRLQMFDHFAQCIRSCGKYPARQYAMQLNVFAAMLCALRTLTDHKMHLEGEAVQKAAVNLIVPQLGGSMATEAEQAAVAAAGGGRVAGSGSVGALLRLCASETLGRLAHVIKDAQFVAGMAQFNFDKLKACRDAVSRTGHSLALGCLHRHVGSLGSGQHLNTSVSILLALAEDQASALVQTWALSALALIADTGGPMFRGYAEPTLAACLKLLLSTGSHNAPVALGVASLVSALITTVGPELQHSVGPTTSIRSSLFIAASLLRAHPDARVRAEAVQCYQQMHLFAGRYVDLNDLVDFLVRCLSSEHLCERTAATACLRQLCQTEAAHVWRIAGALAPQGMATGKSAWAFSPGAGKKDNLPPLPETGLEGGLFYMLDLENDVQLRKNIKEILLSLVQATADDNLSYWLALCKEILAGGQISDVTGALDEQKQMSASAMAQEKDDSAPGADDEEEEDIFAGGREVTLAPSSVWDTLPTRVPPRWRSRVLAAQLLRKLIVLAEGERAHTDLALARELSANGAKGDYLVLHLSDLVRMSFMAATGDNTQLRLVGLAALQDVIARFATVPEPEFPGHLILEQFQAQVGAALRPAFAADTPSDVTAAACQVCSTWIGSGVARDLNDLRRVHALLDSSLHKLRLGAVNAMIYGEAASTLEKLAILKAWAEVYVRAIDAKRADTAAGATDTADADSTTSSDAGGAPSLLALVSNELPTLIAHWLLALRDWALLSLPSEYASQLPAEGGAFYTPDSVDQCRQHYRNSWAPMLLAACTWLAQNDFTMPEVDTTQGVHQAAFIGTGTELNDAAAKSDRLFLLLGIAIEALCNPRSAHLASGAAGGGYNHQGAARITLDWSTNDATNQGEVTAQLCLRAIEVVLRDSALARETVATQSDPPRLCIELLNVLHRLVMSKDSVHTLNLCADTLHRLLDAFVEVVISDIDPKEREEERASVQSGVSAAHPSKCVASAALEVLLCLLVKLLPSMKLHRSAANAADPPNSTWQHQQLVAQGGVQRARYDRLPAEKQKLVHAGVTLLGRLPGLCHSAEATMGVLPCCLHVLLAALRECARVPLTDVPLADTANTVDESTILAQLPYGRLNVGSAACLQALRQCIETPVLAAGGARPSDAWTKIVCAAMLNAVTMVDSNEMDPCVALLAAGVFIVSTTGAGGKCPSYAPAVRPAGLRRATMTLFDLCLHHPNVQVQRQCCTALVPMFGHTNDSVRSAFVTALGPKILNILSSCVPAKNNGDQECETSTALDPAVFNEMLKCVDVLVSITREDKRLKMVNLYVQLLVAYLDPDATGGRAQLHNVALTHLTSTGRTHRAECQQVLRAFPELRGTLEQAAQHQHQQQQQQRAVEAARLHRDRLNGRVWVCDMHQVPVLQNEK